METSSPEKKEMLYNRYYDRYDTIAVSLPYRLAIETYVRPSPPPPPPPLPTLPAFVCLILFFGARAQQYRMASLRVREWEWEQVTRCSDLLTDKVENKKKKKKQ